MYGEGRLRGLQKASNGPKWARTGPFLAQTAGLAPCGAPLGGTAGGGGILHRRPDGCYGPSRRCVMLPDLSDMDAAPSASEEFARGQYCPHQTSRLCRLIKPEKLLRRRAQEPGDTCGGPC